MSKFERDTITKEEGDGWTIECRRGLWGVSAPSLEDANREARRYHAMYLADGEYSDREPIHRESDIIQWGIDRNIYDGSTPQRQALKGLEEACELYVAIMMGDRDGIIDGIGDTTVCNVHQARFLGMQTAECIEHSWNEIKDRGGEMRSGVFVKEADLADAEPDRGVEPDEPMERIDAVYALRAMMDKVFGDLLRKANVVEPKGGES